MLGVAAAVAGLAGLEPLAMGLTAAKTAADVTLALAGEKDWKAVREDAIGLALFGAGRIATGAARARAGTSASRLLSRTRGQMNALTAERAAKAKAGIEESVELRSLRSANLKVLRQQARGFQQVRNALKQDAATPFFQQSLRVIREHELELPREAMLGYGHDVTVLGSLARGTRVYAEQKDIHELAERTSEVLPSRGEEREPS